MSSTKEPPEAVRLVSVYVRDGEVMAYLVVGQKHVEAHVPRKILGSLISGLGMAASTLLVADRRA